MSPAPHTTSGEASPPLAGGYRDVLRVAYPLALSMGAFTVMQFCDRIFLARYSSVAIQAALPAGILSFTLICFFQALAGYAGTFVAQYHGAGQPEGCVRATAQGIWLSLLSWPVIVALIPLGLWLMRLSGHAPEVLRAERSYFCILTAAGVVVPMGSAIGAFLTGQGRMRANTLASIGGCLLNVVLDYGMIFGRLGFAEMGIKGAAIATVIAGCFAPAVLLALFLRDPLVRRMGWRRALAPDWPLARRMIRYGGPSGGHLLVDVGAFSFFVMLTGRLPAVEFAASNIGFSINSVAFMPLVAISIAASIVVGQCQGRSASDDAARAGWTALMIGWCYMGAVAASFLLFPESYYRLFRSREAAYTVEQLVAVGRPMMLMMAVWGMFDTVNVVLSGALKGAGDTRFVLVYMLAFGWLIWIPGELILLRRGGGILAAWIWLTVYVLLLAVGFWWRWQSGRWRAVDLLAREVPLMPSRPGAEGLVVVD
jgi:MATE family multidrug resistance protein